MRKILLPVLFSGILLAGCNGQDYRPAPMPPITPPQAYTEPEQQYDNPGSLFSASGANDLYADNRAHRVGDIVLIKIVENSKSKSKADTTASRNGEFSLGISALLGRDKIAGGIIGADPMIAASNTSGHKATGETKRENYVTATIAARVAQVLPGGILQIQAAREIRVNDETQYMVVTGLIRTADVAADNSIESTQMADSSIAYYGKGILADKQKAGWLTRLLDTISPF